MLHGKKKKKKLCDLNSSKTSCWVSRVFKCVVFLIIIYYSFAVSHYCDAYWLVRVFTVIRATADVGILALSLSFFSTHHDIHENIRSQRNLPSILHTKKCPKVHLLWWHTWHQSTVTVPNYFERSQHFCLSTFISPRCGFPPVHPAEPALSFPTFREIAVTSIPLHLWCQRRRPE